MKRIARFADAFAAMIEAHSEALRSGIEHETIQAWSRGYREGYDQGRRDAIAGRRHLKTGLGD